MTLPPARPAANLTLEQVAQLLDTGHAQPLLPGHFPVPVLIEGEWWHLPDRRPGASYELAPAPVAALFAHQHARLRAAREASGTPGPGP